MYERLKAMPTPPRPSREFIRTYRDDPVAFRHDIITTEADVPYQDEILAELHARKRAAVRSPHGAGKTAVASWAVLWFVLTRPDDTKIPTTASAWRQLTKYLWPEMRKWSRRVDWGKVGRGPFSARDELLTLALKPAWGGCEAFAVACQDAATIEGAHASNLLYVFDEAKAIPVATWDAAEGAFASGDCYALAISTPGVPMGRFYDIHSRKPGYEDWWTRHVTLDEAIAAGMVKPEWAEARRKQWGEDSSVYQQRVLGKFAADEESAIISLALVEAANDRWREWDEAGRPRPEGKRVLGVDVARFGTDKSAIAERVGLVISSLDKWGKRGTMETAGRVAAVLGKDKANVDVIGIGAGVVDRLREQGFDAVGVNFGAGTDRTDKSGEVEMLNVRAAAWWGMRERLMEDEIALPIDDELTGDLVAPRYGYTSSGKLKVESKDDIRKRLGRSPDAGDAVVLAYYEGESGITMLDYLRGKYEQRGEEMPGELAGETEAEAEDKAACWFCGEEYDAGLEKCPRCGMEKRQ